MLFQGTLSIPANTAQTAPVIHRIGVSPGVTDQVFVGFPPGCKGLVHLAIWHLHWQLWPWTPGQYFQWDGYVFDFRDRYPIDEPPYELVMKGWSEDDSYAHEVLFMVTIEPEAPPEELRSLHRVLSELGLFAGA